VAIDAMSRHEITRRKVIASAGTLVAGGTALAIATQETDAQLSTDFNGLEIPDRDIESSTPIETLDLSVDASYQYETSIVPDRLQLRLQAKTGSEWRQIDAINATVDGTSYSSSTTLEGSLLTLDGLETIVPSERGATNTESIEVRLTLTARYDGREIGKANASETVEIQATREDITIGLSVGGSGSVGVTTETPTE
jgi:hypothetical protein